VTGGDVTDSEKIELSFQPQAYGHVRVGVLGVGGGGGEGLRRARGRGGCGNARAHTRILVYRLHNAYQHACIACMHTFHSCMSRRARAHTLSLFLFPFLTLSLSLSLSLKCVTRTGRDMSICRRDDAEVVTGPLRASQP